MRTTVRVLLLAGAVLAIQAGLARADNWWGKWETVRGSGDKSEETRSISGVEAIEFNTIGVMYVDIGDEEKLVISGDDNLFERIETEVHGRTLVIETEDHISLKPRQPLRFYLTVKKLDRVELNSSGDMDLPHIKADRFRIELGSSGDLRMDGLECREATIRLHSSGDAIIDYLEAEILEADLGSSGDLNIKDGHVTEQDIELGSSGDYKASNVTSDRARVRTGSSGDAYVRVTEFLDAETGSSGDINYYGSPRLRMAENSSGDVRSRGN